MTEKNEANSNIYIVCVKETWKMENSLCKGIVGKSSSSLSCSESHVEIDTNMYLQLAAG